MNLFAADVLAGAYRGGGMERTLLSHAVADTPVTLGRLKRDAGEAFCVKSLNLADCVVWEPVGTVTCPACLAILTAKGLR